MDTRGKITLACGLGGGIGALVALQMNPLFWWVGMLVGALVGYLSYDFKEVVAAVPRAWKKAGAGVEAVKANDWLFIRCGLAIFALTSAFTIPVLFFSLMPIPSDSVTTTPVVAFSTFFIGLWLFLCMMAATSVFNDPEMAKKQLKELPWRRYNLITVYGYHLWRWLGIGLWWLLKRLPMAAVATAQGTVTAVVVPARFVKYLFILIHSELRLLCGCDAVIGAAIGYFSGNAIIGALAGAAVGVLNFEIISKRLLKLVPIKTES